MKKALITRDRVQDGYYLTECLLEKDYQGQRIKRRAFSVNIQRVDRLYEDLHVNNSSFKLHYDDAWKFGRMYFKQSLGPQRCIMIHGVGKVITPMGINKF